MDSLAVLDIRASVYVDEISEFDAEIVTGDLVHLDLALFDIVRAQTDQNGISPLLSTVDVIRLVQRAVNVSYFTDRTIMVSPRKSWRASIVAGFSVATTRRSGSSFRHILMLLLTRVVICGRFVDNQTVRTRKTSVNVSCAIPDPSTYDFLGLKIAVDVSSLPGPGRAPLGSARVSGMIKGRESGGRSLRT